MSFFYLALCPSRECACVGVATIVLECITFRKLMPLSTLHRRDCIICRQCRLDNPVWRLHSMCNGMSHSCFKRIGYCTKDGRECTEYTHHLPLTHNKCCSISLVHRNKHQIITNNACFVSIKWCFYYNYWHS